MAFQLPRLNVSDSFTNLGSAFDAQKQQAGLSELMTKEQLEQVQALNDPKTNLALAKQTADAQAGYPTLATNVQATGVGDGIMKGVSNAIGNAQQIGRYHQQVNAYKDIQNTYQQAQAKQRELVMGQIAADQGRRQGAAAAIPQELRGIYGSLNPAGQDAFLGSVGTSTIGNYYEPQKTARNKEIGIQYAGPEAVAKELADRNVRTLRGQEFGNVDLNSGQLSAADRERYHRIYGYYPEDAVNTRERQADMQTKEGAAYKAGVDTQTYATQQALELQSKDLANKLTTIKLQAEPYEVESRLADAYQRRMISGTKFQQAQQAIQMWDGLLDRMNKGDMPTQGEMALFSSGMKVLAGQVPELNKAFEGAMNLKKGQKPKDEDWNKFFGAGGGSRSPATAIPNLHIQPSATQGNLMQSPNTGKWYNMDQRDAHGYPVEVPAPSTSTAQPSQVKQPATKEIKYKQDFAGSGKYKYPVKVPVEGNRERAAKDPYLNEIIPKTSQIPGLTPAETKEYAHLLERYRNEHLPTQYNVGTGDFGADPLTAFFNHLGTLDMERLKLLYGKHRSQK